MHALEHFFSPLTSGLRTVQTFNSCTSWPDVCHCLVVQTPKDDMSKNKPSTSMDHLACESKLRSVVRSSMHPCPGIWVEIGRAVVYYARAARAFSAGIKCRHCTLSIIILNTFSKMFEEGLLDTLWKTLSQPGTQSNILRLLVWDQDKSIRPTPCVKDV